VLSGEDRKELEEFCEQQCWQNYDLVTTVGFDEDVATVLRQHTSSTIFILDPRPISRGRLDGFKDIHVCEAVETLRVAMRPHIKTGSRFLSFKPDWAVDLFGAAALAGFDEAIHKAYVTSAQSENTALHLSRTWIETILRSLPGLVGTVPVNRLRGALAGTPGVIVAAGPSLDKNIHLMREMARRAAVCACNTTLEPLERHGVLVDMLCVAEAKDISAQLTGRESLSSLALLAGVHAHHSVYGLPARAVMPCVSALGPFGRWVCEMLEADSLNCGGTVTTLAFATLQRLGCDPIIMVGQDCAFDDAKAYAACTDHSDAAVEYDGDGKLTFHLPDVAKAANASIGLPISEMEGEVITAPAWGGRGTVRTSQMFDDFRTWFEEAAYFDKRASGRRLINATEGGASIRHFDEHRLADVIASLPLLRRRPVITLLSAAAAEPPIDAKRVIDYLEGQLRETREAGQLAAEGARIARRLGELKTEIGRKGHTAAVLDAWVAPRMMQIRTSEGYDDPMSRTTALYDAFYDVATDEIPDAIGDLLEKLKRCDGVRAA